MAETTRTLVASYGGEKYTMRKKESRQVNAGEIDPGFQDSIFLEFCCLHPSVKDFFSKHMIKYLL